MKYTITYSHITDERSRETTSITQLAEWLEEILNDRFVTQATIKINTEEKK
jgi:hypothetical protein